MTKNLDEYFRDWESHVFGYGYGSGEPYTIPALRTFLDLCRHNSGTQYDFEELERALTPTVAWLLINTLCHASIIEYGTSPRFGWLTVTGKRLRDYAVPKGDAGLFAALERSEDDMICYPDACNCGPNGYEAGRVCQNPFWLQKAEMPA